MTKEPGNLMTDQEKPSYLQKREKKILKNSWDLRVTLDNAKKTNR